MRTGALKYREDILDGIDKASDAIAGLYRGDNLGKRLIRLARNKTPASAQEGARSGACRQRVARHPGCSSRGNPAGEPSILRPSDVIRAR
jgi:phosphopantothenate synthetase